jgi:hypothetical protein
MGSDVHFAPLFGRSPGGIKSLFKKTRKIFRDMVSNVLIAFISSKVLVALNASNGLVGSIGVVSFISAKSLCATESAASFTSARAGFCRRRLRPPTGPPGGPTDRRRSRLLEALTKRGQAPRRLGASPLFVRACYSLDVDGGRGRASAQRERGAGKQPSRPPAVPAGPLGAHTDRTRQTLLRTPPKAGAPGFAPASSPHGHMAVFGETHSESSTDS